MISGALGFFLGSAPGLIYLIRNMAGFQREIAKAQGIARTDGELLDMHLSFSLKADYLLRPRSFIRDSDGNGLRLAKQHLLSVRKRFLLGHMLGAFMVAIGALLGTMISVLLR